MEPDADFWKNKRVCVTGGSGLLGFQIVRQLLDLGAKVGVLSLRPHPQHPLLRETRVDWTLGDIRDPAIVRRALADCDVVFHTAGVVAVWGPALSRVRDVHVVGTRNVLACAPGGSRVVHTSSVVTVGASHAGALLDEESAFELDALKIDYVHAKRAAEALVLEASVAGRDVVVTNPGYLVGPEDYERSVIGLFCSRYWRGQLPLAPPGGINLVDNRDVATGHVLAAERGQAGRRYILGGENRTFPEFMALLAQVGRMNPRGYPTVPWWALMAFAACAELRSRLTRIQPYPSLQHSRLNRYCWFYRSDRAAAELGYASRPLLDTLADTYRWYSPMRKYQVGGLPGWWMRPEKKQPTAGIPVPKLAQREPAAADVRASRGPLP